MKWVAGIRKGILYTVTPRPLDPRWSAKDRQVLLACIASGLFLGWNEDRAFQVGEAYVFNLKHKGITWSKDLGFEEDFQALTNLSETT